MPCVTTRLLSLTLALLLLGLAAEPAHASGTLTPLGSTAEPIRILDHHVDVVIQNGYVRVEVTQTFFNPNSADLEAIYAFPVPEGACLSEMSILSGEQEIHGEVVEKDRARKIYEDEKDAGNDSGLAEQQDYQRFEIHVSNVRAGSEVQCRFAYYQRLTIDTGVVRWVYPLEEGGTDQAALDFWSTNTAVERSFSLDLEVKSAWPIDKLRLPGFDSVATTQRLGPGHLKARLLVANAALDRDVVAYYKLADDLPGRVEMIAHRPDPSQPGTFMMVVTPGVDLAPLAGGADYLFVLDTSGSMKGKIATLTHGVTQAITQLHPADRFRIVTFSSDARELTRGWVPAHPEFIEGAVHELSRLKVGGSTNLYAGITKALGSLDSDRATSLVLVTDAVANEGVVSPAAFAKLLSQFDVRFFGFLLGNGANWPLMRVLCDASGGFYAPVSNTDDIVGQIMLAKSKVTHMAMHDARLSFGGVDVFDRTSERTGKLYRGQQLVVFGRYRDAGPATVALEARITGVDKTYATSFDFPAVATQNPEVERLWAMARIQELQTSIDRGQTDESEGEQAIADYGVAYQLVTDHTSMIVLSDEAHARHGIERKNQQRLAVESVARVQRTQQPARNNRVDQHQPAFGNNGRAPRGGGGAIDPWALGLVALLVLLAMGATEGWRLRRAT